MGISSTSFKPGSLNPKFFRGWRFTQNGYKQITTKLNRFRLEHSLIAEQMCESPLCLPHAVPIKYDVHHFDGRHGHNCLGNLQLLDSRIHRAIPKQSKVNKRILAKEY